MNPSAQVMLGTGGAVALTYATWDPATKGTNAILTNGNKTLNNSSGANFASAISTVSKTYSGGAGGKWVYETTVTLLQDESIGYATTGFNVNVSPGTDAYSVGYNPGAGTISFNGSTVATVATSTAGDKITVAFDFSAATIAIYKNGTLLYTPTTGATTGNWFAAVGADGNYGGSYPVTSNFGATSLSYPISGFNAGLY
jgi:hypothetical protein